MTPIHTKANPSRAPLRAVTLLLLVSMVIATAPGAARLPAEFRHEDRAPVRAVDAGRPPPSESGAKRRVAVRVREAAATAVQTRGGERRVLGPLPESPTFDASGLDRIRVQLAHLDLPPPSLDA